MLPTTETFDTVPVQEAARVPYWNAAARNLFDTIEVEPVSRRFVGHMQRKLFGAVQLATIHSTPVAVHGRASARLNGVYLLAIDRGQADVWQRGRQTRLRAGALTVLCAHEPYRLECSSEHRAQVLYIPGRELDLALDAHISVAHQDRETELLIAFINRLASLAPREQTTGNLLDTTMKLLQLTWPTPPVASCRADAAAWQERLWRHVDQHLGDSELSAASIAEHFGISRRYVQMIFARSRTSVSEYILERRLQVVAERLCETRQGRIGEVAIETGFSDLSHFCRRFRKRFGISAREYRARHRRA